MPYLKFRISCSPLDASGNYDGPRSRTALRSLVKHLHNRILEEDPEAFVTTGWETLNNYGDPCHHHYHLHSFFDPDTLTNPLRTFKDSLRKKAKNLGIHLAGNKVWAFTLVEEPQDLDRFLRYPLKQYPILPFCTNTWESNTPDNTNAYTEEFHQQVLNAREEQKRSIELNILKRQKTLEKLTFRDKLFAHLEEHTKTESLLTYNDTHRYWWATIMEYYHDQKRPICISTIDNYTISWLLQIGELNSWSTYDRYARKP